MRRRVCSAALKAGSAFSTSNVRARGGLFASALTADPSRQASAPPALPPRACMLSAHDETVYLRAFQRSGFRRSLFW
jgi:hypothetical protein